MRIKVNFSFLTILMSMVSTSCLAYDIAVKNDNGNTIYYNYINNKTELEVTNGTIKYHDHVVIPEKVKYNSSTLKVTSIGREAFYDCDALTSISIPNSVTSIAYWAFGGCENLTSITIPNSVTTIDIGAFICCFNLTSVTLSNNINIIEEDVFYRCNKLTSITIPNSVTRIKTYAFRDCNSLTSLIIGSNVTTIDSKAFYDCRSLKTVVIPSNVTEIGSEAFQGIDFDSVISLIKSPWEINGRKSGNTFSINTFDNAILYVPIGSLNEYKALGGWKDFVHIEEGTPTDIRTIYTNNNDYYPSIYDLNGKSLEKPQKGINIINGKKVVIK